MVSIFKANTDLDLLYQLLFEKRRDRLVAGLCLKQKEFYFFVDTPKTKDSF